MIVSDTLLRGYSGVQLYYNCVFYVFKVELFKK